MASIALSEQEALSMDADRDDAKRKERRERAREHPMRVAILAILSLDEGRRGMSSSMIRSELPDTPSLSVIAYHTRYLVDVELVKTRGELTAPLYSLAPT